LSAAPIHGKLLPRGGGLARALVARLPTITLDWDARCKSRLAATTSAGVGIHVFLPRGTVMRGGDVLVGEDGTMVLVQSAPQALLVVKPCAIHGKAGDLTRAAYHLGNRHVAVDLRADSLRIEPDPVLANMLKAMHFDVVQAMLDFEPEAGAYDARGHHHHGHEPTEPHTHGHTHDHHHHAHDHPHDR
jgi:urease accessory protein